jgi:hypothetical protein
MAAASSVYKNCSRLARSLDAAALVGCLGGGTSVASSEQRVERAADFPVPNKLPLLLVASASVSVWLAVTRKLVQACRLIKHVVYYSVVRYFFLLCGTHQLKFPAFLNFMILCFATLYFFLFFILHSSVQKKKWERVPARQHELSLPLQILSKALRNQSARED